MLSEDDLNGFFDWLWNVGSAQPEMEFVAKEDLSVDELEHATILRYKALRKAFWPCWGINAYKLIGEPVVTELPASDFDGLLGWLNEELEGDPED